MAKPIVIFLDFDGCISPITPNDVHPAPMPTFLLGGMRCGIPEHNLALLSTLTQLENVEVLWISSWEEWTSTFHRESGGAIAHCGWLRPPYLDAGDDYVKGEDVYVEKHEKIVHFLKYHPEVRTVIVADDDSFVTTTTSTLLARCFPDVRCITFTPETATGLTLADGENILSIAR